jgi:hypothetical protein
VLNKSDREARLQRAKVLGRIAYRHLDCCEIVGVITYEGEEKHLYQLDEDGLTAELIVPFRPHALPNEFSRIQIRADGRKVFEIRWDGARNVRVFIMTPAIGSERCSTGRSQFRSIRS